MSSAKVYALNLNEEKDWTEQKDFSVEPLTVQDRFVGDRSPASADGINSNIAIDVDFGAPVSLAGFRMKTEGFDDAQVSVIASSQSSFSSNVIASLKSRISSSTSDNVDEVDVTWGYVVPRRYWRFQFSGSGGIQLLWFELKTYEEYVPPSPYPFGVVILSNANIRVKYYDFYSVTLKALASMRFPSSSCTVAFFGYL